MESHRTESFVETVSVVAAVHVVAVPPDCSWGSGTSYPYPLWSDPPYPLGPYLRGRERGGGRGERRIKREGERKII